MRQISFAFILIVLALAINIVNNKPLDPSKIVVALNCGSKSDEVNAPEGTFKYLPDEKYVKGGSVAVDYHNDANANDAEIKFALDKEVFMYERHTYQAMTYELPVKKGKHTIIMKFAQMYFKNKGERVFDIKIGSKIVVSNFDVIERAGSKYAAHEEYLQIDVKNDGVYYNGQRINQGVENNKLKLSFAKGKADNPIIQAIIVYLDSAENSCKQEYLTMKNKWNSQQQMLKAKKQQKQLKELILIQKKKQKIVIRNDQLVVEEEQQTTQSSPVAADKYGIIRSLLMGPIGVIFWTILFGYLILSVKSYVFKMQGSTKVTKSQ